MADKSLFRADISIKKVNSGNCFHLNRHGFLVVVYLDLLHSLPLKNTYLERGNSNCTCLVRNTTMSNCGTEVPLNTLDGCRRFPPSLKTGHDYLQTHLYGIGVADSDECPPCEGGGQEGPRSLTFMCSNRWGPKEHLLVQVYWCASRRCRPIAAPPSRTSVGLKKCFPRLHTSRTTTIVAV